MRQVGRRQLLLAASALCFASLASAQVAKVWRVGVLETVSKESSASDLERFQTGLRERGYIEGKNLVVEFRSADGRVERFPEMAAELVRMKVDLILTRGTPATLAARNATRTIPIVSTAISNPVASGLVTSLARPGGNVTGLESFATELGPKRLELLKETFPTLEEVGYLSEMSNPATPSVWKAIEMAAPSLGFHARLFDVRKSNDLGPAFDAASKHRIGALLVGIGAIVRANGKSIAALAAKYRLPTIYSGSEFVDAGGLMSYAVSYPNLYYRAASYVDKIFKGAKPGELPIEQPTVLELVINLKTAKALGITIPQSVLLRADRVID